MMLVFIENFTFALFGVMFTSLLQLGYLLHVKPFEIPRVQKIEVFNVCMLLLYTQVFTIYSDYTSDIKARYYYGWMVGFLAGF